MNRRIDFVFREAMVAVLVARALRAQRELQTEKKARRFSAGNRAKRLWSYSGLREI